MRLVAQRVSSASVTVDGKLAAEISLGLMVLVGAEAGDAPRDAELCAGKIAHLRVFKDESGKMNRSLLDMGGEALVVSQFTLLGDISGGRRPSFIRAARPEEAEPLLCRLLEHLRGQGVTVKTGVFGADMDVALHNDGPVTILFDSKRPET